jgi:hypothetical protein
MHLKGKYRWSTIAVVGAAAVVLASMVGLGPVAAGPSQQATGAAARQAAEPQPDRERCQFNAPRCMGIGFTDSWFNGITVNLEYSHRWFCASPPASAAPTGCEVGAPARVRPSGGVVVSPIYILNPIGFTPPGLQCPRAGNCIDHPPRVDLSRVFGPAAANVPVGPHSHIVIDREEALSSWWPAIVIGVKTPQAWNQIAKGKSLATVQRVRRQHPSWVTPDLPTNLFLFFQVLPGGDDDSIQTVGP